MPRSAFKTLTMLVIPVMVAMTAQAAAAKPHHSRVKDDVAARQQIWGAVGNPTDIGGDVTSNDANVYRDDRPIPYYDINPHGG